MLIKTSVYLDEADKRRLAEYARASGTSEADLLRRGVRLLLAEAERPRPRLALGESKDGRSARNADELLRTVVSALHEPGARVRHPWHPRGARPGRP